MGAASENSSTLFRFGPWLVRLFLFSIFVWLCSVWSPLRFTVGVMEYLRFVGFFFLPLLLLRWISQSSDLLRRWIYGAVVSLVAVPSLLCGVLLGFLYSNIVFHHDDCFGCDIVSGEKYNLYRGGLCQCQWVRRREIIICPGIRWVISEIHDDDRERFFWFH